jgi:hypothetical protein
MLWLDGTKTRITSTQLQSMNEHSIECFLFFIRAVEAFDWTNEIFVVSRFVQLTLLRIIFES